MPVAELEPHYTVPGSHRDAHEIAEVVNGIRQAQRRDRCGESFEVTPQPRNASVPGSNGLDEPDLDRCPDAPPAHHGVKYYIWAHLSGGGSLRTVLAIAGLLALGACSRTTRTIVVGPNPEVRAQPSTAATLGVPPGHLPDAGECRIWIPGMPPGHQPKPKSRPCPGISATAPAGSWIIYRPMDNRKLVHVQVVDARRAGVVILRRIYDMETTRLLREESP
jgi:hypothetical protein